MKYFTILFLLLSNGLFGQNLSAGTVSVVDILSEQRELRAPTYFALGIVSCCGLNSHGHFMDFYSLETTIHSVSTSMKIKSIPHVLKWGETNEFNLTGKVSDHISKENIMFGNVALYRDDELIASASTDENGNYVISKIKSGNYTLKATYVGYQDFVQEIDFEKDSILDISLEQGLLLPEVVILAYKSKTKKCYWTCGGYVSSTKCYEDANRKPDLSENIDDSVPFERPSFSFFPNPAIDQIQIKLTEKTELLMITTATGRVMHKEEFPAAGTKRIYLNDYINGTYFISIVSLGEVISKKLIVVNQ